VLIQKLIVAQIVKLPAFYRMTIFFIGYLMKHSVSRLYRVRWESHPWMMVLKDLEGRGHGLIGIRSQHLSVKTGKL
jgi:hypothetical protein